MTRTPTAFIAVLLLSVAPASATTVRAQAVERFALAGERVGIHNVAGNVRVESGTGDSVIVEVTRGGNDAKRLLIQQLTDDGRASLCIVYPNEHIIYRPREGNPRWNTSTNSAGECRGGVKGIFSDRKVEVRSRGEGVEAWADVRIVVPRGRNVKVWNIAGDLAVTGVNSGLELHTATAPVSVRGTRGALDVHTGSGSVTIANHAGDVAINTASGEIGVDSLVDATSITLDAGSGRLRGHAVAAESLRLHATTADISLGAVTARRVHVETGGGSVALGFMTNVDSLAAESQTGQLTLTFPAGFGAEVELETGSGTITVDFPVRPPHDQRGVLRGTIGDGHGRINVQAGSGDIRLLRAKTGK